MVAAELARLQEREKFLERELRTAQTGSPSPAALDDEVITRALGEEAARILQTAREAASQIRIRAEESAARALREAGDEAQRVRQEAELEVSRRRHDASADAEAELQMAKQQGREMVNEARDYRERVLADLTRRRELARQQIEQLVHGRDRLVQAFDRARVAAEDVISGIGPMPEHDEFVNLAPTTGPVPLMVRDDEAGTPAPAAEAAEVAESPAEPDDEHPDLLDIPLDDELVPEEVPAVEEAASVEEAHAGEELEVEPTLEEAPVADERIAPVVALFGGSVAVEAEPVDDEPVAAEPLADDPTASVDSLFARLRAARAETVVERVSVVDQGAGAPANEPTGEVESVPAPERSAVVVEPEPVESVSSTDGSTSGETPFSQRDAALTPLIVAAARKLKRVLADEQNDILHAAKSSKKAVSLDTVLPGEAEHLDRWISAIEVELKGAATAGAASLSGKTAKDHLRVAGKAGVLDPARTWLADTIVRPLRERVATAVDDCEGDSTDLSDSVRAIYREWKNQRIDEHLDDVMRMAFGRAALSAVKAGTPLCWLVDPDGPACADAEDNSLAGAVPAGKPYPTDHTCAPAHAGCRCMLQQAPR